MRPVAVVVHWIATVVNHVEAMHVIDGTLGCQIVVLIGLDDLRTRPNVLDEIGMRIIDAAVQHGHHNLIASLCHGPGAHRADVRPRFSGVLTAVKESPLPKEQLVIRMNMFAAAVLVV